MAKCLNCGSAFSDNFCSHCGQERVVPRIRFKHLVAQFFKFILLIESHILITIKNLIIRPGKFVREYLDGKRAPYCSPIQFFLLFMTIYLIFFGLFGDRFINFMTATMSIDQLTQEQMAKIAKLQTFIKRNLNILYFMWPIGMALFLRLFFNKKDIYYSEFLVLVFYLFGIDFILSLSAILLTVVDPRFLLIRVLIALVYFPFAISQFFQSKKIGTYVKIYGSIIGSFIVYMLFVQTISFIYIVFLQ